MANNNALGKAKEAKNDEFYTIYADIEKEMNAYLEYDENVFRNKTVLLPCDDPEWSNFTRYFAQNFEKLGLKKLISTSYAIESKKYKVENWEPTLFESQAPWYNMDKSKICGKIFTLDHDTNKNGRIDIEDLEWKYLEGDGDFRSEEIKRLRDEADIVITNPPFSLFREFVAWIMEAGKRFAVIGNKNAITYKEVFPLIKDDKIWCGAMSMGVDMLFSVPKEFEDELVKSNKEGSKYRVVDEKIYARAAGIWFTNLEHGRRHEPLSLMTMQQNLKFSKHKEIKEKGYQHYDNYDAIEIPFTDAIPCDYMGVMGVPISFLDKYCPEQFEILGITKTWFGGANKVYPEQIQVDKHGKHSRVTKLNDGATVELSEIPDGETYYIVNDRMYQQMYARVLIKAKE